MGYGFGDGRVMGIHDRPHCRLQIKRYLYRIAVHATVIGGSDKSYKLDYESVMKSSADSQGFPSHKAACTRVRRRLQLRFDFDSTGIGYFSM